MGVLDISNLKDFENVSLKERFLLNVESSLKNSEPASVLNSPLPVEYPELDGTTSDSISSQFYDSQSDSGTSHEEEKPAYHTVIFGMMSQFGNMLDLPETKPIYIGPINVQDPTIPIQRIISSLESANLPIPDVDIDFILSNAQEILDAVSKLPDDVEPLCEKLIEMNGGDIPGNTSKDAFCSDLEELMPIDLGVNLPSVELPSPPLPPFIDIDSEIIPTLSLVQPPGIITIFSSTLIAVNTAMNTLMNVFVEQIVSILDKLKDGIDALLSFLFGIVLDAMNISLLIELFPEVFQAPGFVSTFTTMLKYLIGMILIGVLGHMLGVGLIVETVIELLNLWNIFWWYLLWRS